jgi:hypothetical protein
MMKLSKGNIPVKTGVALLQREYITSSHSASHGSTGNKIPTCGTYEILKCNRFSVSISS